MDGETDQMDGSDGWTDQTRGSDGQTDRTDGRMDGQMGGSDRRIGHKNPSEFFEPGMQVGWM